MITDIRWHPYRVPFVQSFRTAHGILTERVGMLVQVSLAGGITGIGEIAPLPEFSGGTLAQAESVLPALARQLRGKQVQEALAHLSNITSSPFQQDFATVYCGLEIALLDAQGKCEQKSVAQLLASPASKPKAQVAVNAVIAAPTREAASAAARLACDKGFRCIKLKVGMALSMEEELTRIAAVREAIGPTTRLRLDANEAWTLPEALIMLTRCVPYDIQYIEQPVHAEQLHEMRVLRNSTPIAIAADEAVTSLSSALQILDTYAADILIIKPQLAGGLRIGQQIIREADQRGVQCVITSTIESGIGVVAALHLAAATPEVMLPCGLSTLSLLTENLLSDELPIHNGCLAVPTGYGLGVTLATKK